MVTDVKTFMKNLDKSGDELMKLSRRTVPPGTLEQSFEQANLAAGDSPEKAAAKAKTAVAGHDYAQTGF
jgi:hypothetical protein